MLSLSFIREIEKIFGRENVLTGEADRQNYAYDAAVLPPVVPGLVVRPTRTDQLGPLIQKCYEEGIPITIRGSGTNLSGGTIPDSTDAVIILTNSLDRILEINEEEMYAVVEPGVITCDLAAAVAAPVVNTGVFLLGCKLFFMDFVREMAAGAGYESAGVFMIVGFVGINFLLELGVNIVLAPVISRLIRLGKKA